MDDKGGEEGVTVVEAPEASQHLQQTPVSCVDVLALTTSSACKLNPRRAPR